MSTSAPHDSDPNEETERPAFAWMDGIFILFSIILLGLATQSLQAGAYVDAAYEASLGTAGLLLGTRNPLTYVTGLDLEIFNQVAVVGVAVGLLLFVISVFV